MTTSVSFSPKNSLPFSLFNSQNPNTHLHTPIARPNSLTPIVLMNSTSTSEYYNTAAEKSTPINSPLSKLTPISHSPSFIKTPFRFVSHDRTNSRASTKSVEKMDISHIINSSPMKPSPSNFFINKSLSNKRINRLESDQSTIQTPHSSAISNLKKSMPTPKAAPLTDSYLHNNSSTSTNKKYKFRINKLSLSKNAASFVDPDIEMIKRNVKIQGKRSIKLAVESKEALNEMKEINITKKKGQVLTAEEEKQVKLLRKKVEISNTFESKVMNDEEKKLAYRQLILEFHPDKTKHDIEFSLGVFYFLQVNKERFIGGTEK